MKLGASVSGSNTWDENREDRRYPLTLPLEYRIYGVGVDGKSEIVQTGSGRTVNISSGGVLFEADGKLREGVAADLCIAWPATLSKSVGLTLRVRGRIAYAKRNRAALITTNYEFRTRSLPVCPEQNRAAQ